MLGPHISSILRLFTENFREPKRIGQDALRILNFLNNPSNGWKRSGGQPLVVVSATRQPLLAQNARDAYFKERSFFKFVSFCLAMDNARNINTEFAVLLLIFLIKFGRRLPSAFRPKSIATFSENRLESVCRHWSIRHNLLSVT